MCRGRATNPPGSMARAWTQNQRRLHVCHCTAWRTASGGASSPSLNRSAPVPLRCAFQFQSPGTFSARHGWAISIPLNCWGWQLENRQNNECYGDFPYHFLFGCKEQIERISQIFFTGAFGVDQFLYTCPLVSRWNISFP